MKGLPRTVVTAALALAAVAQSVPATQAGAPLRAQTVRMPSAPDDPQVIEALSPLPNNAVNLTLLGTFATGVYNENTSAATKVAFDAGSQRMFVVNVISKSLDIISVSSLSTPTLLSRVVVSDVGTPTAVASIDGVVALSVQAITPTNPGRALFFDITGTLQNSVTVGAQPVDIGFSPDGNWALTADSGVASALVDPEGSITAIDFSLGVGSLSVTPIGFSAFSVGAIDPRIRIISPTATVAEDLEPKSIGFSPDSARAYVTLQTNNALAVVNLSTTSVAQLVALGAKNHNALGNGFDASDQDGLINIVERPVQGMYQPDGIDSYAVGGVTYLVTANEGDARSGEDKRVGALALDPTAFPDASSLKAGSSLGRLQVTTLTNQTGPAFSPDTNGDGDIDVLYSFGARSFSIWNSAGGLVFDSGDHMERVISNTVPAWFNSDASRAKDGRSPNKGPEPEGVVIGQVNGRDYAFVGLERVGGVMVYDVSNPFAPAFVQYVNNRVYTTTVSPAAKDLSPEGLAFVPAAQSPNGKALLLVANEVSGSTSIYQIDSGNSLVLLHTNDVHGRVWEFKNDGSAVCAGSNCVGGAARMSTVIKQVRNTVSNTLLLDGGDQFQGTLYYKLFKSDVVTVTMNALGYQAMAVGNHEFDDGPAELRRLIDGLNFPVVSANIDASAEPLLAGKIKPSTIVTTAGGDVYGVVGVTTEDTGFLSSSGPNIKFLSAMTTTQAAINSLLAQGVNRIILASHLGYDVELALARVITGVDIIVGGHTHTFLYSPMTTVNTHVAFGPYPTPVTGPDGATVLVVQDFQWGYYLGRLNVDFTPDGRVSSWSGNPIYLDSTIANDPLVTNILSPTYTTPVAVIRAQVVGTSTVPMSLTVGSAQICRAGECVLGNMVTDAMLWKANQVVSNTGAISGAKPYDFAITNGGGLRAPIDVGAISQGEVLELLPFGNALATFEITGTHVITALENGLARIGVSGNGRFPQVSGLRYYFDSNRPIGQRLRGVFVKNADGTYAPLNPNKVYRVVTNDFMRKGGDDYAVFRDFAINPYDFGPALDEAVTDYIQAQPNDTVSPVVEGRIVAGDPPSFKQFLPVVAKN